MTQESIVISTIRSFFIALFGIIGLCIGFFVILLLIGLVAGSQEGEAEKLYKPEIVPNGDGEMTVLSKKAPVILKLNVTGTMGTEFLNAETIRRQLLESRMGFFKDDRVKALIVFIQSPGGAVNDADGIYNAIKAYKKAHNIPVYAYVDGMCASGGMYVASACDKIYATDSSLIGSIGVLIPYIFNFSDLMQKVGVSSITLSAGKGKDALNPTRPWKEGEQDNLEDIVKYYYKQFVEIVTTARPNIDKTKLVDVYGAKLFPAPQAKEYGFIDEINNSSRDVIKTLAKELSIEDNYYQVVELHRANWYSEIFRGQLPNFFSGQIKHRLDLGPETNPDLMNKFLYLYRPGHG